MSTLSPAQIGAYAAGAGFHGQGLRDAIAVALAESGGNPRAVGHNADRWHSRDRGLWQINDHWHPEVSDAAAFDPATAAAAAYRISSGGTSWRAWSTWNNGAAAAQFGRAQMAANQSAATGTTTNAQNVGLFGPTIPIIPGVPNLPGVPGWEDLAKAWGSGKGIDGIIKELAAPFLLMAKAGAWIADPHNWTRVVLVAGGAAGILMSLEMIAKSGAAGSTAAQAAAIPGQAVSAAKDTATKAAAAAAMA